MARRKLSLLLGPALAGALALAGGALLRAETTTPPAPVAAAVQPPQAPAQAAAAPVQAKPAPQAAKNGPKPLKAKKKAPSPSRPLWAELNAQQQQILAPLKPDWDNMERERKVKWIGIAKRYPKMKPEAQDRVQKRMDKWANLSPEQRRQARENYRQIAKKLPPDRRAKLREQWAQYQAMSPQERQVLLLEPAQPPKTKKRK